MFPVTTILAAGHGCSFTRNEKVNFVLGAVPSIPCCRVPMGLMCRG